MIKKPHNEPTETVALDPKPEGKFMVLGGSQADDWNQRLANLVVSALPGQSNRDAVTKANKAVLGAMVDMAPADPIEGILMAQLMAACEASLCMYRKGWDQPPEYFEARTKYLQLADKAARTVMMLTERLDHHRGRGQQQITVKHVTTNNVMADQAIITDRVTTASSPPNVPSPALLAATSETPMPVLSETRQPDLIDVGGVEKKK
jgi:hypothetical protein